MQAGRMCIFATLAVRAGGLRTLARPGQDILASGVRASVSFTPLHILYGTKGAYYLTSIAHVGIHKS